MVINGYEQFNDLVARMQREDHVFTLIKRDPYFHFIENVDLLATITFPNLESFTVSMTHKDTIFNVSLSELVHMGNSKRYVPSSKHHSNVEDISILAYLSNQSMPDISTYFSRFTDETLYMFKEFQDTNKIIPVVVWGKMLHKYNSALWEIINKHNKLINTDVYQNIKQTTKVLARIEQSGLAINKELFDTYFSEKSTRSFKNRLVYSEYNPFTTTGRPSNRFGGVNFSALNKSDGTRECFVSRYENGRLIQIDFEAYHLRLIANELNVDLPSNESIHTYLAKKYFNTDEITPEMYEESKRRTFEIMYGMSDETYNFELFEKIKAVRNIFVGNYVNLANNHRVKVEDPNPSKLFNYYMQSLETVKTMPKLNKILDVIEGTDVHLILYTYDSIMLDMSKVDGQVLAQIIDILKENNKFPIRTYVGKNYHQMKEITIDFCDN